MHIVTCTCKLCNNNDYFAMEKSVTTLQTILFFDVAKLFFSNFFTNQDSKGFKHFPSERKFIMCIKQKALGMNY